IKLPIAIDGDSRGERMLRAEQPLRQTETIGRRVLRRRWKQGRNGGRYLLALVAIVAAPQYEGVARLGHLGHHLRSHDVLFHLGQALLERIELGINTTEIRGGVVRKEVIEQTLLLFLGTFTLFLSKDEADGFVER